MIVASARQVLSYIFPPPSTTLCYKNPEDNVVKVELSLETVKSAVAPPV